MRVWYQHTVGNTLLSGCYLCTCLSVYSLSLCLLFSSVPCSLSPSVVESILSIYLCRGSRSAHFHCIVHPITYQEGHLIPSPCFPSARERCRIWQGEEYSFRNLRVAPEGSPLWEGQISPVSESHTDSTAGPVYSSTKDAGDVLLLAI